MMFRLFLASLNAKIEFREHRVTINSKLTASEAWTSLCLMF